MPGRKRRRYSEIAHERHCVNSAHCETSNSNTCSRSTSRLLQRECDYASYTPETLGGPGLEGQGLWTDDRRLSAPALSASLMHVQEVLCAAGRVKEAFPVLAILEHVRSLRSQNVEI